MSAANQWLYITGYRIGDSDIANDGRVVATNVSGQLVKDLEKAIPVSESLDYSNAYFNVSVPAGEEVKKWIAYNSDPTIRPPTVTNQFAGAVTEYVWSYNSKDTTNRWIVVDYDYITYTLAYHNNGGSGSMPAESHIYTNNFNLASNQFSKKGYSFNGWTNETAAAFADMASVSGSSFGVTYTNTTTKTANLYAQWTPNAYTVTLDPCDGLVDPEIVGVTYDAAWPALPTPTRDGHRFVGWFTAASGGTEINTNSTYATAANTTNYAHWAELVTATFKDGHTGATLKTETLDKGGTPTPPVAPEHDGYYAKGWTPAVSAISVNTTFTMEYAQYSYTVVFHADNGTGAEQTQQFTYNAPAEPLNSVASMGFLITGYNFQNWTNSAGTVYNDGQLVSNLAQSGAYHLYAVWTLATYTIAFDGNGADNPDAMAEDTMILEGAETKPLVTNKFEKGGYTFDGWATNVAASIAFTNCEDVVSTNLWMGADETNVLYAVWHPNSYTVVFNPNGGTGSMDDQVFYYDQAQELSNREGHIESTLEFRGWATNQEEGVVFENQATVSNLTAEANGVVTLYAVWSNGDLSDAMHCANLYWTNDDDAGAANWSACIGAGKGYNPDNDSPSGSSVCAIVSDNEGLSHAMVPSGANTGAGRLSFWYKMSSSNADECWLNFSASGNTASTVPLQTQWTQYVVDIEHIENVKLVFEMNYFSSEDSYTVWIDQMKWEPDGGGQESEDSETIKLSLQDALVNDVEVDEKYASSDGGTSVKRGHAAPRVTFTADPAPIDGVVFDSWELTLAEMSYGIDGNPLVLDGNATCFSGTMESNCYVRAKFKWLEYQIDYNANDGHGTITPDASSYIYTNEVALASASPSDGYSFAGWTTNATEGTLFVPGQVVTGADIGATTSGVVTLYANWTQNVYTVTFCYTNSDGVADSTVRSVLGTESAEPPNATAYDSWAGHKFVGWDASYSNVVSDVTVNALYEEDQGGGGDPEEPQYYVVTFDAKGGECEEDARNVKCGDAVGELPEATRDNYTLVGWFTADDAEVTAFTVPGTNVTYFAKWNIDGLVVTGTNLTFGVKEDVLLAFDECFFVETSSELKSVTASGLPAGVKFDSRTRTFSGSPTKAGLFYVTCVVKNEGGYQYSCTAIWNVGNTPSADNDNGGIGNEVLAQLDDLVTGYDYELVGFTNATAVTGLPAGLKFTKATGVISGTPTKPGKAAMTFTGVNKAKSVKTVIVVDGGMHALVLVAEPVKSTSAAGTTTGGGIYAVGKKVTIRATAAKDCVFAGWYDDEDNPLVGSADFRTASFPYIMGDRKTTLTAAFATGDEDKDSLGLVNVTNVTTAADGSLELDLGVCVRSLSLPKLSLTGLPSGLKYDAKTLKVSGAATKPGVYTVKVAATNTSIKKATDDTTTTFVVTVPNFECDALPYLKPETNAYDTVRCGVVVHDPKLVNLMPVDADWTVKVTGLPTGLKLVQDKTTKAYSITGVSTAKAGSYTVMWTASKKGEKNQVATITLNVEALPEWAVGTFDGGLLSTGNDVLGLVQGLAVTANGKVSGKLINGDGTWTLAAASFDAYDAISGEYVATVIGKSGKLTFTNEVFVYAVDFGGSNRGQAEMLGGGVKAEAVQNLWKTAVWKNVAKDFANKKLALDVEGVAGAFTSGTLELKFAASGAVTTGGKFVTGYNETTKRDIVYSASCSAVLIPQGGNEYVVYLYFPSKKDAKGNVTFAGYSAMVRLEWDGSKFVQLPND